MLFNSNLFIFGFLPLAVLGFYALGSRSREWALRWLIFISVLFYVSWRPLNLLLVAPSILLNFAIARTLQRLGADTRKAFRSRLLLILGITFNVGFLGYFKYKNFFLEGMNDAFGTTFILTNVILPLGISFITFQKIAFLVDVHAGRVESFTFQDYCLFVLFFPQLIAGPIVHFREMMPQFQQTRCRLDLDNASVGLTLFIFGLFKKVVLADSIAPTVSSIYQRADAGAVISLSTAWIAAIGFTLQIYFDFSGYSDMAIGLARIFGIRLPANFDSPLRATSIIDYWLRWHMTLTRFLTAYIYNPLVLALTRRRLRKGRSSLTLRNTTFGSFAMLLVFPTLVTMLISGIWHGAGYLFLLWGALHGVFLSVNHAWRLIGPRLWKDSKSYQRVMVPVGFLLTFSAVTTAMVLFRAQTLHGAGEIVSGMVGMNGIGIPSALYARVEPFVSFLNGKLLFAESLWSLRDLVALTVWIAVLLFIALVCPNTLRILARHEPALNLNTSRVDKNEGLAAVWRWDANLVWAAVTAIVTIVSIVKLSGPSEFLYWQF